MALRRYTCIFVTLLLLMKIIVYNALRSALYTIIFINNNKVTNIHVYRLRAIKNLRQTHKHMRAIQAVGSNFVGRQFVLGTSLKRQRGANMRGISQFSETLAAS